MTTGNLDQPQSTAAGLLWGFLSLVLFVAAAFAIFPVSMAVRLFVETTHAMNMALWSILWASLAAFGVVLAARAAFGSRPRIGPGAVIVLSTGSARFR